MFVIGIDPYDREFGFMQSNLSLSSPPVHSYDHEEGRFLILADSFRTFVQQCFASREQ
jgi:hypothetical protein